MYPKLGHSPPGGLGAWLTLRVSPLCRRLRASSAARAARDMGNSMRSTQAPPEPERPLSCSDGKSGFLGAMLNSLPGMPGARTGRWEGAGRG